MPHSSNMGSKFMHTALAIVLAMGMTVPLGACQSNRSDVSIGSGGSSDAQDEATSADERWVNFDDGSEMLSLDVPYLHSNADELSFKVLLEQGTLASPLAEDAVGLGGALDGWKVASANRTDDTTIAVIAQRPEGLANNGASTASVTVSAQSIVLAGEDAAASEGSGEPEASGAASSQEVADLLTSDEVNELKGVEWPADAVMVDEDIEAVNGDTGEVVADTPEEIEELLDEIEKGEITTTEQLDEFAQDGGNIDEGDASPAEDNEPGGDADEDANREQEPYQVMAMFVNPALEVDFERSTLSDGSMTASLVAIDFTFDEALGADAFSLKGAEGCNVQSVRRVSDREAEVALSLPESGVSALDGARLVLAADANESEVEVACNIAVPEPWLDLSFDYADETAGTVTFVAELNDSANELAADTVEVSVGGKRIDDATVENRADNAVAVTVRADEAPEGSAVVVEVPEAEDLVGQTADVGPAAALSVASGADDRAGDPSLTDLLMPVGTAGLKALAEFGWQQFCKEVLDPNLDTNLYQVKNNDLLAEIVKTQGQIADLSAQVSVLSNTVRTGQNAAIVNDAKRLVSRIKTQEVQLSDGIAAVYQTADPKEREQAAKDFAVNEKDTINGLATNLGELYGIIVDADSATGHDLIAVYDEMMAQSYNWGAQTYTHRQQFREALATVWTNGAQIVALAYGAAGGKDSYLNSLDAQTRSLDELINTTHAIDATSWVHTDGKGAYSTADLVELDPPPGSLVDSGSQLSYYCNTTGKWYTTLVAKDTTNKWDKGFKRTNIKGALGVVAAKVSSPFRDWTDGKPDATWDGVYLNTAEAKQLASKLHDGQTMESEFELIGLPTAKYLVTSEKFDDKDKVIYANNDWYFDTFEVAAAKQDGSGFTANKQHYDASDRYALVTYVKHINWYTSPDELFVLKQVPASGE